MEIETLGHLSQSSINMFLRCPCQFFYRYVQGLKIQPTGNLTLGKSVDSSLDFNYKFKIESRTDREIGEVLDFFSTDFEKRKQETDFQEANPAEVKDDGVRVIKEYQTTVSPHLQPLASQKEISVLFNGVAVPTVGYIDVIDQDYCVIDNKVKSKSPSKDKAGFYLPTESEKIQMTIYESGLLAEGVKPTALRIDTMVTLKTPKVVSANIETTSADYQYVQNVIKKIVKSIEAEIFIPVRSNMLCSKRHCGYWNICEKENGGCVKE
jgi:CRISPR/Cas system-associated exonuclease Cas4 (RecB family)